MRQCLGPSTTILALWDCAFVRVRPSLLYSRGLEEWVVAAGSICGSEPEGRKKHLAWSSRPRTLLGFESTAICLRIGYYADRRFGHFLRLAHRSPETARGSAHQESHAH